MAPPDHRKACAQHPALASWPDAIPKPDLAGLPPFMPRRDLPALVRDKLGVSIEARTLERCSVPWRRFGRQAVADPVEVLAWAANRLANSPAIRGGGGRRQPEQAAA